MVWVWFGSSIQEALTHGAVEPAVLPGVLLKHMWVFLIYLFIFFGSRYDCTFCKSRNILFNTAIKTFLTEYTLRKLLILFSSVWRPI